MVKIKEPTLKRIYDDAVKGWKVCGYARNVYYERDEAGKATGCCFIGAAGLQRAGGFDEIEFDMVGIDDTLQGKVVEASDAANGKKAALAAVKLLFARY